MKHPTSAALLSRDYKWRLDVGDKLASPSKMQMLLLPEPLASPPRFAHSLRMCPLCAPVNTQKYDLHLDQGCCRFRDD